MKLEGVFFCMLLANCYFCANIKCIFNLARILAIDYGTKRTGIAVTDPLQIIVNPCNTVETKDLIDFLTSYLEEEQVEAIVIGQVFNKDGSPVYFNSEIEKLIRFINNSYPNIQIEREDESFTSEKAKEILEIVCTRSLIPEPIRIAHLIASGIIYGQSRGKA